MLADLERANLFVVPLDTERSWYRYHHLFADVLHARLLTEDPDLVPQLHRRASDWYASHGLVADAVRHALAAEDFDSCRLPDGGSAARGCAAPDRTACCSPGSGRCRSPSSAEARC